ncbi:DUF4419 domain-containing protein [Streptomyces sp. TLI_171]|uniref:DUF4419 domain-containing protein n=1 Tax=Streptomyces sp. TLI_171 TaxID=1938859 RepID=UPI000C18DA58|nr:DUF4419 domain-containing protein [Streptomyces sp. TLI_171]RKE20207.1 uncharacterized protein DUF4419 [Streptomyces sp. TLI_171]
MAVEITLPFAEDERAAGVAAELADTGNDAFLRAAVGQEFAVHHRSTRALVAGPTDGSASSLLLHALHLCFRAHLPVSLSPDLLWYAVVHEVATHVRLNGERYAGLFTRTPGTKRTIEVRDDSLLAAPDWQRSLHLVQPLLRKEIGEELADLFQPAFSTTTPVDASATLVALMDVVSPYYDFRWRTLCGIPRIRLEGAAADWRLLADRVGGLEARFAGLREWLRALRPVLETIAATAAGGEVDEEFWRSIYKWKSYSGGCEVTGWITAFFAHRYGSETAEPAVRERIGDDSFPSHLSLVPFEWQRPDGALRMAFVGGVLGIERDAEWIRPRLGFAVLELTAPPLDADWTAADVNAFTGRTDAVLLRKGQVEGYGVDGDPLPVTRAVVFGDMDRLADDEPGHAVLEADDRWYPAEFIGNGFLSVRRTGTDLATALRAIPG